jgi:hypothetical protein
MNPRTAMVIWTGLMTVVAIAYLLYLAATWNQYQADRARRDEKINELLDRIPVQKVTPQEG